MLITRFPKVKSQNELSRKPKDIKYRYLKTEEFYIHLMTKIEILPTEIQTFNSMIKA